MTGNTENNEVDEDAVEKKVWSVCCYVILFSFT